MRLLLIVALILGSFPAIAQVWDVTNSKCEAGCKVTLDRCSAAPKKIMATVEKEVTAYSIETSEREKADIKFENAFQVGEKCWDRYYRCAANCRPPKRCIDACQSTFKQCFAAGERTMKVGLREMKKFA
jgi:hypothetical protein